MKILIGSNGGLTGVYLAKRLRLLPNVFLYGADATDITVGQFFVDKQCHLPIADDSNFLEELIELLNKEKIDVYLPTHSREIIVISKNEDILRKNAEAKFLVSPYDTYTALDNKKTANKNLSSIGIPVPSLIEDFDCSYPILMKNDQGSGSTGIVKIENQRLHKAYKETIEGKSFYEVINGTEYTLDCMFDSEGNLLGMNQRKRVKTIGGAVSITTNSTEFDISSWVELIAKTWKFCGCVNFQYIVKNGVPYFIDVTLRYPSGGLPLTVQSGLDIPKLTVDVLCDKKIYPYVPDISCSGMTMYRYFEEIFK